MEFSIKQVDPESAKTDCVVVGIFDTGKLTAAAQKLDAASGGAIKQLHKRGDVRTKVGATTLLHDLNGVVAKRVVVVGLGKADELTLKGFRESTLAAMKAAAGTATKELTLYVSDWEAQAASLTDRLMQAVTMAAESAYRFDRLKSQRENEKDGLGAVTIGVLRKPGAAETSSVARGAALAEGVNLAKDLGNLPSNICTPTYLANQALALGKQHKFKVKVLERAEMEKLKMGSFLSVTKGSREPPKFIVMEYEGGPKKHKPVVLVGKGITFDTGGISLKPGADMDEMKYDMSGAGSVLGTMKAIAAMKLPVNVIGLVPACENMPDGNATKPGDIVTSMSGQTIEILNTDAEGRLILCDALTYAERYSPAAVIDIATLTGACVIALGHVAAGMYANRDELADELTRAGHASWDRIWRMPLWDDYQEQIKSPFADMANIGGRPAGSVTAACFLARYAKKYSWAHLDIAGTAWKSGQNKGSTGRPVPLLTTFLMRRAGR